jgi:3-phenylpropionate/trans-cinnamate dioxygenase ferredoxin reductase subunit
VPTRGLSTRQRTANIGLSRPGSYRHPANSLPIGRTLATVIRADKRHRGPDPIVLVGGGLCTQRCAETLRREGYDGAIRIVCAEPHRPYDRPPLSKQLLLGSRAQESLSYRPPDWYEDNAIELLLGVRAIALRPRERRLSLSDGTHTRYRRLLIATGSRPRQLPLLAGYDNVSVLRTRDDAQSLRDALACRPRLSLIGAGFIGQEVAASARRLGAAVTMIEAAASPLQGLLGAELGEWFATLHRGEGVDVRTGCTVQAALGNGSVRGLVLSDGRVVETDHVVLGVGVQSETEWLAGSGLPATGGVPVDDHGRTRLPDVLAAGDVAAPYDRGLRRRVPGSHWEAAGRDGARTARVMLGLAPGPPTLTSFWTDQYGVRIQYLGAARRSDQLVIDGDLADRDFTALFMRAGRPAAALLVGRPRALPAVRTLIEKGRS